MGYNAQAAVDASSQVIVAEMLLCEQSDVGALAPILARIKHNVGRQARELWADMGYCSEANLRELSRHVRGYVAAGRQPRHGRSTSAARKGSNASVRHAPAAGARRLSWPLSAA